MKMPFSRFRVDTCLPGMPGEDQEVDEHWKQESS